MNFITLRHAKVRQTQWLAESISEQEYRRLKADMRHKLIRTNKPLLGQKTEKEMEALPAASFQS